MTPARRLVAYVLPVHNEEDGIADVPRRTGRRRPTSGPTSTSSSSTSTTAAGTPRWTCCSTLRDADDRVTVISLARNFGHQIAVTAGLDAAAGRDAVIVMDTDLQDPPEVASG